MSTVEGWKKVRICEFGTIVTGSTPDTKNDSYWGGDIPFVSPADFKSSVFIEETARTLSNAGVKQARLIPQNSILVTCIGSIGGIAIASCSCVTNQQINSIVCAERFEDRFIFYVVQHNISKLIELAGTTTLPIINKNTFGDIEIVLSTFKPEQTKIAEVLSTVDQAIEQTEALIAKQQRIKTGLMQDLLTRGIDEHSKLRSEQTHEFKDSLMGRIPVEWKVQGVTDICSEIFLGLTTKVDYVESGVPLVRAKDINTGRLLFEETLEISSRQHRELTKYRKARRGDVLISKSGTLGICALVDTDKEFSIYESIIVMQPNTAICDSRFLLWLMRYDSTQSRLLGETVGSTVGHLNLLDFRKLKVPLPSKDEQGKIAISIGNFTNNLEYDFQKLSKLKSLKTALMQDLLTGKVRVTSLLTEPQEAVA